MTVNCCRDLLEGTHYTLMEGAYMQCVTVGQRRLTAEDVRSELRKKDKEVDELHGLVAAGTSELSQIKMELDWAKDSQRRAEEALAQKRTRKVWPRLPKTKARCILLRQQKFRAATQDGSLPSQYMTENPGEWRKLYT